MPSIRTPLALLAFLAFAQGTIAAPPILQRSPDAAALYSSELRNAQFERLRAMPSVDIEYDGYGRVRTIRGNSGIHLPSAGTLRPGNSASTLLGELKELLMASGSESLSVRHVGNAINGGHAVFMDIAIDGIPVIDGGVNVRVDANGSVDLIGSKFVRATTEVVRTPPRSAETAREDLLKALEETGKTNRNTVRFSRTPALRFWTNNGVEKAPILVWSFETTYVNPQGEIQALRHFVDASTGQVRDAERTQFGLNRTVYDMANSAESLYFMWNEGFPNAADAHGFSVYNLVQLPIQTWASAGLGQHYETLGLAVHWGGGINNAFFDYMAGTSYPILGFGDNMAFEEDAVAHEYGHGIFIPLAPPRPPGYRWYDEWFAANEFWGDLSAVFTAINQMGDNPPVWKITSQVKRDLSFPKAVNADFRDWYWSRKFASTTTDVAYKNSTIFGHALYLLVHGGYHSRMGASERKGPIPAIYNQGTPAALAHSIFGFALVDLAVSGAPMDAYRLKSATMQTATILGGPALAQKVENAWLSVGVGYQCSGPPVTPIPQIDSWFCRGKYTVTWPQIPSVTYHAMVRPNNQSYDFAGVTVTDGPVGTCSPDVPAHAFFRMRACNGCGCSPWSVEEFLQYYKPCL